MISHPIARTLNALGLFTIAVIMLIAFGHQLFLNDLPCPLCIMQRIAFLGIGAGLILNLTCGHQQRHYAIIILSALAGMGLSIFQILIHILPGSAGFGGAVYGLHFYTWAFIIFFFVLVGSAIMLLIAPHHQLHDEVSKIWFIKILIGVFVLISIANLFTTVLICGFDTCPSSPTSYHYLEKLLSVK
jgi:disulfide bond formation protein DsbB